MPYGPKKIQRYRQIDVTDESRYKQIQLHRTDLQDISGPIWIKNKNVIFRENCLFSMQIVISGLIFCASTVKCLPLRV